MPDGPPIYVGYLRLPARHRRFVVGAAAVLVCLFVLVAGVIASSQRDPGDAVWETGHEQAWTGVIRMEPYPMLVEADGTARFIVGMGKYAVRDQVSVFDGEVCRVRGFSLAREHRRMIELTADEDAIARADAGMPETAPIVNGSPPRDIVVFGEIVDGKCYLGAMKPGDGKAHKACAILCISGGLPPLVAAEIEGTGGLYPLLRVGGSTVLPERVLEMVGEPVRIEGRLTWVHRLPVLDVEETGVIRVVQPGRSPMQAGG